MVVRVSAEVMNGEKIQSMLQGLPARIRRRTVARGVRSAAKQLKQKMVGRAPVDSGATKKLKVRRAKTKRTRSTKKDMRIADVVMTPPRDKLKKPKGVKTSKHYYPAHVELGAPKKRPARPENPWMRDTLKRSGPMMLRRMQRKMLSEIIKHARESSR